MKRSTNDFKFGIWIFLSLFHILVLHVFRTFQFPSNPLTAQSAGAVE